MSQEYDQITAYHYAAFRPSLHAVILEKCLATKKQYNIGLDIGCGTGQSAIALTKYCTQVIGIEPSQAMLDKAIQHSQIQYLNYDGENLPFEKNEFDIITFAGSLFYAKSQTLLNAVEAISKPFAKIIVYDFEVLLDNILNKLQIKIADKEKINYNHQVNFSGLDIKYLKLEKTAIEQVIFEIQSSDLAHLLLSSKDNYTIFKHKFGTTQLHEILTENLNQITNKAKKSIKANLYYTIYTCQKS